MLVSGERRMLAAIARIHRSRLTLTTAATLLVAILAGLVLAISASTHPAKGGFHAYVNATALNLRAGPGTSHTVLGILLKYDSVIVNEQTDIGPTTWYSIEASGGYTNGWVAAEFIQFGESPMVVTELGMVTDVN